MSFGGLNRRENARRRVILAAALCGAGVAGLAQGQLTTWTGASPGSWSVVGNWNNGVPNSGAFTAFVDAGNVANRVVTVDGNFTVGTLNISAGDQVSIGNNLTLAINSLLSNAGTVTINSAANNASLSTGGGSLLVNGGGTIVMSGANALIGNNGTFTNANNTIIGQGAIAGNGMFFINQGTVNANVNGSAIYIDPVASGAGMTNSGTLTSSNGGTLRFNGAFGGGLTNTGTVSAQNGSVTQFENSFGVTGGTFTTSGTGIVKTADGNTVGYAGINNLGNWTLGNNSTSNYSGDLFNSGSINMAAAANNVHFNVTSGTTSLTGGGTVNMNTPSGGANLFLNSSGGRLINVNNTIRGTGNIGNNNGFFTNSAAGVVSADVTGAAILCDPVASTDGFVNQGNMRAINGGLLQFTGAFGGGVNNTGGTLSASGAGSEVQFYNTIGITGGTFTTSAGGIVRTAVGQTVGFASISNTGHWILDNNSTSNYSGDLFNSGSINLSAGANNVQFNFVSGTINLTGAGTINLNATTGGTNILQNSSGGRLFNVNNTIRGTGNLANNNGYFTNEVGGLVNADIAGLAIFCDPVADTNGFVNNGNMRATNGGILQFSGQFGGSVTNNGTISAQTGSEVQMFGGNFILGGTINSSGTGVIRINDGNVAGVQSITLAGNVVVGNNANFNFSPGTITNTGSINVNAAANNAQLQVVGGGTVTLTGGGTVNLTSGTGTLGGVAFVNGSGTLVNQNNTIRGFGNLAANAIVVINNGNVSADVNGAALFVDPQNAGVPNLDFTNNGTMQASNGGILQLTGQFGGQFNNASGRIIANNASSVQMFSSSSVIGGTLSTAGSGTISVVAGHTAFITNVTNNGAMVVNNNADLQAAGVFTNNGSVTLSPVASNARLIANGSFSLAGTGTVFMTDGGSTGRSELAPSGGTVVIGASQTVRGVGNIGGNNGAVTNNGTINADQNGKTIFVDPVNTAGGFVNNNIMTATNGGILQFTGQFSGGVTNNGTISAGTASLVQYFGGNGLTGGTLTSSGTGAHEVAAGNSAFFANNINTGTINVRNNADFNGAGTLINNGTIALNPVTSNARFFCNSGTYVITGNGTILMNPGSGGNAEIGTPGNAIDVGPSITVRGRGNIGGNNGAIINRGLITASGGGEIFIDPVNTVGGFQNFGTLRVETGSQLRFNGQFGGGVTNSGLIDVQSGGTLRTEGSHGMSGGTMTLNGTWQADSSSSTSLVNFRGAGTLSVSNSALVAVQAGGGTLGTSRVQSISTASSGRLDLTNHDLLVDYAGASAITSIRTQLQSGFGGGTWNGATGIISSSAAASTSPKTAIGYAEASEILGPSGGAFSGLTADGTSILLQYTVAGDADLSKQVNLDDFTRLAAAFGTAGNFWSNGDFNYDATVNLDDFTILAANFGLSIPADLPRGSAVPEPALLSAAAAAALFARRRRN